MLKLVIVSFIILTLAVLMTMTGRGGGNFYVLTLLLAGIPMHEAATSGQFILFATSFAAMFIFGKAKTLSIPLALFLGGMTTGTAFFGGFAAYLFDGKDLKIVFAFLLALAGILMLLRFDENRKAVKSHHGYWHLKAGETTYSINLWLAIPLTLLTGFFSGMVGVSGGSFLVPLMVLACGVPMRIAVGTASVMVAGTAFAGFLGHALHGSFHPSFALPVALFAVVGGLVGGKIALKTKPKHLKMLFALTTLIAAVLMIVNISVSG